MGTNQKGNCPHPNFWLKLPPAKRSTQLVIVAQLRLCWAPGRLSALYWYEDKRRIQYLSFQHPQLTSFPLTQQPPKDPFKREHGLAKTSR